MLNSNEKEILKIIIDFYETRNMNLVKIIDLILKAPDLSSFRSLLKNGMGNKDEYKRACELVNSLKSECPNTSVVVNCALNTKILMKGTGAFNKIGDKNVLIKDRKMLFQPHKKENMMVFENNLIDHTI